MAANVRERISTFANPVRLDQGRSMADFFSAMDTKNQNNPSRQFLELLAGGLRAALINTNINSTLKTVQHALVRVYRLIGLALANAPQSVHRTSGWCFRWTCPSYILAFLTWGFCETHAAVSLTITKPGSGVSFIAGTTLAVEWGMTSNIPNDPALAAVNYINVALANDGVTFTNFATGLSRTTWQLNYTLPSSLRASGAKVRVRGMDSAGYIQVEGISGAFAIIDPTTSSSTSGTTSSAGAALPPTVQTLPASSITSTSAQLNGSLNPNGSATTAHFEFGTTINYGSATSSGSFGTTSQDIGFPINGLSPVTLYHFRLVSSSIAGTSNGSDVTFTTAAGGAATTTPSTSTPATNITTSPSSGSTSTTTLGPSSAQAYWTTNIYSGAADGRIRMGGWADIYNGYLRFDVSQFHAAIRSAKLRLWVLPDENRTTSLRLARVTSAWANGSSLVAWSNQPTTVDIGQVPAPAWNSWVEIDLTSTLNGWITGQFPNFGVGFFPNDNNHAYTTFAGPTYSDASKLPQLVVESDTIAVISASVEIVSTDFVVEQGHTTTIRGRVLGPQSQRLSGVDVAVSDSLLLQSRPVGKTDANGEFTDTISLPANAKTGNYQLVYSAGGKTTTVIIVAANVQTGQITLLGAPLDFSPGPLATITTDANLFSTAIANSTPAIYSGSVLTAEGKRLLDAVTAASLAELRTRAGDPAIYILLVSSVACLVPQIAVAAAPACAVVFDTLIDEALVSAFRVAAHTAVNASNLGSDDKLVVNEIVDKVMSVRSAVRLATSGEINRFDFYSQAWDSTQTLLEIKRDADGKIVNVDAIGSGGPSNSMKILRITPIAPVDVRSLVAPSATSTAGPNNGSQTVTTGPTTGPTTGTSVTSGGGTLPATTTPSTAVITTSLTTSPVVLPGSRIISISTLSVSPLISGFCISGDAPKRLVIRAIGPALTQFGVNGVLADPQVRVFDSAGRQIAQSDDWDGSIELSNAFAATGLFGLPVGSKDAALLITLQPGVFTAQVVTKGNVTGIALLEIYEVP